MLRYMGVDTQILANDTPISELRELDGLILSGGAARVGLTGELGNCAAYLELDIPILEYVPATNSWPDITAGEQQKRLHPSLVPRQSISSMAVDHYSTVLRNLRLFGRATTTRSSNYLRGSELQLVANHVKFRPWRTQN